MSLMKTDYPLFPSVRVLEGAGPAGVRRQPSTLALKRLFDVTVAGVLLVLLSPVLLIVAGLVLAGLGAPLLFRQWRPGRWGKPFVPSKFPPMKAGPPSGRQRAPPPPHTPPPLAPP